MSKGIKLTAEQIQHLHDNSGYDGGFREGGKTLPGFEKWWIWADFEEGEYDSGKSAMVDFPIYLYAPTEGVDPMDDEGILMGVAEGGYYYQGDYSFSYDLEFLPEEVEEVVTQINEVEGNLVNAMIEFINDMPTMMEPIENRMDMEGEEFHEVLETLRGKL